MFVDRNIESFLKLNLRSFPAVVLLGTRQCGKSTLVKRMAADFDSFVYLDLQNYLDMNKLTDLNLFFTANRHSTVCLDEVQLMPALFSFLRSEIDNDRRNGRFILLGSASRHLMQNTSESLAGRVGLVTLTPFTYFEVSKLQDFELSKHWFRGAYPDSFLAETDEISKLWIDNYIRTYIERDIPQLGIQVPPLHLRRLLMMLSHVHGQLVNLSKIGESLGTTHTTVRKYIDLFEQTFVLRTLLPYELNVKKRLVKSPKIYIRDSGILHRLLAIDDFNALLGNPIAGSSWEGYAIENIITHMKDFTPYFYRSSSGNEIDLVLEKGDIKVAIEFKMSSAPELTKGNWNALKDLKPSITLIVVPIETSYEIKENIWVTGLENVPMLLKF